MSAPHVGRRAVNSRLGTYFGIFTSLFCGLLVILLILEQLGISDGTLGLAMLIAPLGLIVLIGLFSRTEVPLEFLAAGRRVPAVFTGAGLALTTLGGTGIVCLTGVLFLHGGDAWAIGTGLVVGLVVMGVLIAPFLRKYGGYTVPAFLGRRFESRIVVVISAAIFAVPVFLILSAELEIAIYAARWLTGLPRRAIEITLMVVVVATIVLGGVRSLTWAQTAAAIVAITALAVPACIIAILDGTIPIPQLSHGPVLRTMNRLENLHGVPIPLPPPLAFDVAGLEPSAISQRFTKPFGTIGPIAYVLTSLVIAAGVAAAPWIAIRSIATPTIYESRKAAGWAALFVGVVLLTLSSIAVFLRMVVLQEVITLTPDKFPDWFKDLIAQGHVALAGERGKVGLAMLNWERDAALMALPVAAGFPKVLQYLSAIGAIAAAVTAAAAATVSFAAAIVEDGIGGSLQTTDRTRVFLLRLSMILIALVGTLMVSMVRIDPLQHLWWALALSASTAFPVLVLSVWWRRLNEAGTLVALVTGFIVTLAAILLSELDLIPFKGPLAGALGAPAAVLAAFVVSHLTAPSSKTALELAQAIRIPGRETLYDRELRLSRLKRR
jgi:cation/acetate symporter